MQIKVDSLKLSLRSGILLCVEAKFISGCGIKFVLKKTCNGWLYQFRMRFYIKKFIKRENIYTKSRPYPCIFIISSLNCKLNCWVLVNTVICKKQTTKKQQKWNKSNKVTDTNSSINIVLFELLTMHVFRPVIKQK